VNEAARDIVRDLEAAGIRAELHVQERFPHKTPRRVRSALRPGSIEALLFVLPRVFQAEASQGLAARFHFVFTGKEEREATVDIRDKALTVANGLVGKPDLTVQADSASWLRFLAHERGILRLLLTRKVRLRGRPALLRAFGRCFPS
jgi:alkyl sulfatase BDS1-like metallo-beta-lactamase superfamily hydrolase